MLPRRVNPTLLFTTYDSVNSGSFSQDPSYYCMLRYQVLSYSLRSLNGVHTDYVRPTARFSLIVSLGRTIFCTRTS